MKRITALTAVVCALALEASAALTGNTFGNRLTGTTVTISEVLENGSKRTLFTEKTPVGTAKTDCAFDAHIDVLRDDKIYLYEATGGLEYDLDGDGVVDAQPTEHNGTLRLVASGSDIKAAGQVNMTFVSDAIYTKLRCAIAAAPYEVNGTDVSEAVARMLPGAAGMGDVLTFDPVADQGKLSSAYRDKQAWIVSAIHRDDRFYYDGGALMGGFYGLSASALVKPVTVGDQYLYASNYGVTKLDVGDPWTITAAAETPKYGAPTYDIAPVPESSRIFLAAGTAGLQLLHDENGTFVYDDNNSLGYSETTGVALNGEGTKLYVADRTTLCRVGVNGTALTQEACIAVDDAAYHHLALSPDGAFIFVRSDKALAVYALDDNATMGSVKLLTFDNVADFALSEDGRHLYLSSTGTVDNDTNSNKMAVYELTDPAVGNAPLRGEVAAFGATFGIAVEGDIVYLSAYRSNPYTVYPEVWQIDVSDPTHPFLRDNFGYLATLLALNASGTHLFSLSDASVETYDISDPVSAGRSGFVPGINCAAYDANATSAFVVQNVYRNLSRVALDDGEAFLNQSSVTTYPYDPYVQYYYPQVSSGDNRLYLILSYDSPDSGTKWWFDIRSTATLASLGAYETGISIYNYSVSGDDSRAALLDGSFVHLLDTRDETNISEIGVLDLNGSYPTDLALSADGRYLYVTKNYSDTNSSMKVFDVSDANHSLLVGELQGLKGYFEQIAVAPDGKKTALLVNSYGSYEVNGTVILLDTTTPSAPSVLSVLPAADADAYMTDIAFSGNGQTLLVRQTCYMCTGTAPMPLLAYDLSDPAHPLLAKRVGPPHVESWVSNMGLSNDMKSLYANLDGNFVRRALCDAPLPSQNLPTAWLDLSDVNLSASHIAFVSVVNRDGQTFEMLADIADGNSSTPLYVVETGDTVSVVAERNESGTLSNWYYNFADGTFYDRIDGSTDFFLTLEDTTSRIGVDGGSFTTTAPVNLPPQLHIGAGGYGPMGTYAVEGGGRTLTQRETTLYLGDAVGIKALDVADPAAPALIASSDAANGGAVDLLLSNNTLFAAQESGLFIYDVSTPDALPQLGSFFSSDFNLLSLAYDLTTQTLCVLEYQAAGTAQHLYLLDVNDSANPQLRATITLSAAAGYGHLALYQHTLYVTSDEANATAYNIADPANPVQQAGLMPPLKQLKVSADGKRYYGVYRDQTYYREFFVILDRTFLLPIGTFPNEAFFGIGEINDFSVDEANGRVYLATGDGAAVVDISDPAKMRTLDRIGVYNAGSAAAETVVATAETLAVATGGGVDLHDNSRPQLFHVGTNYGLDENASASWLWDQLQRHGAHLYFASYTQLLKLTDADLAPDGAIRFLPEGSAAEISAFDVSEDERSAFAAVAEANGSGTVVRMQGESQTGSLAFEGQAMLLRASVGGGIHFMSLESNDANASLMILDTNASPMRLLSTYRANDVFLALEPDPAGRYLYTGGDAVRVLDVANPYAPAAVSTLELTPPLSTVPTPAVSLQLDASGRTLYAGTFFGIAVIDVSDPAAPRVTDWKYSLESEPSYYEYALVRRSDDPERLYTAGMEGPNVFDGSSFYRTGYFNEIMRFVPSKANDTVTFDRVPVFDVSNYGRELSRMDVTPRLYLKKGFGRFDLPVQMTDTSMAVSEIHLDLNASSIIGIGTISYDSMSGTEWNITVPLEEELKSGIVHLTITITDTGGATATMPIDVIVYDAALPQPPGMPQHLAAQATAPEAVTLQWEIAEGTVEGYRIYRDGSELAGVGAADLSYEDFTVQEGTTYRYGVLAYNASGESNQTEINVTTPHRMTVNIDNVALEDFNITEVAVIDGQGNVIDTVSVGEGNNSFTEAVASGEVFSLRFDVETAAGTVQYWYNFTDGRFYAQKGAAADFERTTSTQLVLIAIDAAADNWPSDAVHFVTVVADQSTTDVSADFNVSVRVSQSNHRTLFLTAEVNYPTMLSLTPYWDAGGVEADVYEHEGLNLQLTPKATGTARVTLRLRDTEGNSAVQTFNVTIVPAVTIAMSQVKGTAPLAVDFAAQVVPVFGEVTSVMWDFNDSGSANELNASHTFTAAGNYRVGVTVMNAWMRAASAVRSLLVLDDTAVFDVKAGWNYLSLPTSMHLDEEGLQALFADEAVRYLLKQSGAGWAYWDRNLTADPQMQMNRFSALDSKEGFALYADSDTVIELPVNKDNDPDALRRLYADGWYLVGVNRDMSVEDLQALVEAQGKELELVEYIDPTGTMHLYTPDTVLDAQISLRYPRLQTVERTWGFYILIEEAAR